MVYKRYIKKKVNGEWKTFGPYYYESYRERNGITKTRYILEPKKITKLRAVTEKIYRESRKLFVVLGILCLVVLSFFLLSNIDLTGKAVMSIDQDYSIGEQITGDLKLLLESNEFIPGSTKVVINNAGEEFIFLLSDLVKENLSEGEFYLVGTNVSGFGLGYGISEIEYPKVAFVLDVYRTNLTSQIGEEISEEIPTKQPQENVTEIIENETVEEPTEPVVNETEEIIPETVTPEFIPETETPTDTTPEVVPETETTETPTDTTPEIFPEIVPETETTETVTPETPTSEITPETTKAEKAVEKETEKETKAESKEESTPETTITGEIIKSFVNTFNAILSITGNAVIGEEISGEVAYGETYTYDLTENQTAKIISSEQDIELTVNNNQVIITTNYTGEVSKEILIDLSNLNLTAKDGEFKVSLVYEETEIVSASKNINVENLTIINETIQNITLTNVSEIIENLTTKQYKAIIGRPVKSLKILNITQIKTQNVTDINITLPKKATNISVLTGQEIKDALKEIDDFEETVNNTEKEDLVSGVITGQVSLDIEMGESIFSRIWKKISKLGITGKVIDEKDIESSIIETNDNKIVEINEVVDFELLEEVAVGYYTDAPLAVEENLANGKRVTISAPDELNYTDILAYSLVDKQIKLVDAEKKIRLYWYTTSESPIIISNETIPETVFSNETAIINESIIEENISNESLEENLTIINETVENVTIIVNETIEESENTTIPQENETVISNETSSFSITGQVTKEDNKSKEKNNSKKQDIEETNESIILNETVINNSIEINYSEVIINENPIVNNIVRVQVGFDAYDLDNDSYVDYIEWIVPHLSNQTYDIIYITKAEHLDENRTFIEDISDEVKYLDGNWSKPINDSEYVRVTFEIPLDNTRDVTFYGRSATNETSTIEVFTQNGNETLAVFENIQEEKFYKIYLTELNGTQDVFDLKINGSIEFDQILDPAPTMVSVKINSTTNASTENIKGYCNATDGDGDDLVYQYQWYNGSTVYFNGTLFKEGSISVGRTHTCGIRANDSRVLCWGDSANGKLGDGQDTIDRLEPYLTTDSSAYSSVSTGNAHTCGIRANDSRVLCWGQGLYGQLGDGQEIINRTSPYPTTDLSAYISISAGQTHTCGIRANDSRVLCWGESLSGRLGDGQDGVDVLNPNLTTDTSPYKKGFSSGNETLVSILGNAFINNYENWSLGCRAYDFISYSSWMNSSVMTILSNVAMVSVKINSTTNLSNENIKGYCNATDIDGDDLIYQYQWYNGSTVYINGTLFKEGTISARDQHTCGIRANDSRVLCWGYGDSGRLGDGEIDNNLEPNLTTDFSAYTSVSVGSIHTCGIRANDSRVLCWGDNYYGQLGNGTTTDSIIPILTSDSSAYSSISAGRLHTCGIRANDSRVLCWGESDYGRLGDGSSGDNLNPNVTTDTSPYTSINAGSDHTCGIRQNDSRVLCWGSGNYGQLGDGSNASHSVLNPNITTDSSAYSSVSAGQYYTCGIRVNDSRVLCWGYGLYGRLGDGSTTDNLVPNVTADSSPYKKGFSSGNETLVSILGNAFINNYENWSLGCRAYDFISYSSWMNSSVITGLKTTMISVKINSTTNESTDNINGYCKATDADSDDLAYQYQWYNGSTVFINGTLFKEGTISGGSLHTCGIRANDSRVLCWGNGNYGQLGDGSTAVHNVGNPNVTTDSSEYLSVNTKGWHTCGIRVNDSRVLCWGYDNHGQLGDGQTANNGNPNITTDSSIYSSVSAGYYHTCGIRTNDSRVLCWGEGDYGQLGDSSTSAHNTLNPNVTTDSSVYTSIDAGGFHTCGIRQNDSRILCWGWGLYGTLGDGQTSNKGNPNVTTDSSAYSSINSGGVYHTCGIRSNDSRVLCWGESANGRLGDGQTTTDRTSPYLTTDSSPYKKGFSSSEEILVSILGNTFLTSDENWSLSCRAYDFVNYSSWMNSSSLMITDLAPPVVLLSAPQNQGFGLNVTLNSNVTDNNLDTVLIGITPPGESETNYSMINTIEDTYEYNFTSYTNGTYAYRIYANDTFGNKNYTENSTFNLFINLTNQIRTLKDNYSAGEVVNLTDPPESKIDPAIFGITNVINSEIQTSNSQVILNDSVKWKKNVKLSQDSVKEIEIPKSAVNVNLYKISKEGKKSKITANIISKDEYGNEMSWVKKLLMKINIFSRGITGEAVKEVLMESGEYEMEYETPGPVAIEDKTDFGKRIVITSEVHYENILAYTYLENEAVQEEIRLYRTTNGSRELINVKSYDKNNNGLIDYIEWTVPHLSEQTYELIIEINQAEHLVSDRNFISEIYDKVKELDNIWSEEINEGDYVRIVFETPLNNTRDITIYSRAVSGNPKVEVYEMNENKLIAEFSSINSNEYNKIYLTNLVGQQDT